MTTFNTINGRLQAQSEFHVLISTAFICDILRASFSWHARRSEFVCSFHCYLFRRLLLYSLHPLDVRLCVAFGTFLEFNLLSEGEFYTGRSGTTVMKIASTVQTMAAARAASSSARGSRLLPASSDTDNCRWQLPSGLLIDVTRWQSPCSNPFVENFLLQRKGDPFLRRIGIGPQTAKLQENFLFVLCHPLALE